MEDARTGPHASSFGWPHGRFTTPRSHAASSGGGGGGSGGNSVGGGGGGGGSSSGRRRGERSQKSVDSDTKSCGGGGGGRSEARGNSSGLRALQDVVSDTRTFRYTEAPPQPQPQLHQQSQQPPSHVKGDNFEDFMKYLGLADGSADSLRGRRHRQASGVAVGSGGVGAGRPESSSSGLTELSGKSSYQLCDRLSSGAHLPRYDRGAGGVGYTAASAAASAAASPVAAAAAADDFAEEENFFQLIGLMLMQAERAGGGVGGGGGSGGGGSHPGRTRWEPEAVIGALRRFSREFGDSVYRFHSMGADAFPFYQPEMLKMLDLLTGAFSAIGDAVDSELLLFTEQLRSIHLNMRLFLRPKETLTEVDDASLTRLLLSYSERLDRDLRSASAAAAAGDSGKYARRRATALAAAVGRYGRTAERRRQLVLGRMQSLAASVMSFVSRQSVGGGDGAFRKAVSDLFEDMHACFNCLGCGGAAAAAAAASHDCRTVATAAMAATEPTEEDMRGYSGGGGGGGRRSRAVSPAPSSDDADAMSTLSRQPPQTLSRQLSQMMMPQPPQMMMPQQLRQPDDDEAASVMSGDPRGYGDGDGDCGDDAGHPDCSPDATGSVSTASVEPQEALSLQLMERLEGLLSSFLPNERVNTQEFKADFNSLFDWWRKASGNSGGFACDRRVQNRMSNIRDQFDCTQRHRGDSNGVKRLFSEADTAWELIEVAKLMVPPEERSAAMMTAHTAPEWREATSGLVDSVLATLFLYQSAQDASVLSMRLRADLQRLVGRLADCGPVPLLCLLRLRLLYLRARQFSDLLRAHPQGCLILELAQTHRTLLQDECADGSNLSLTVCVPINDYRKFCQHVKDLCVLSFEARAPVTEKTSLLMKASCLKKIEKCCQCTIELQPPVTAAAASCSSSAAAAGSTASSCGASEDALTMGGSRRKPQLVGGSRPSFCLVIRPDPSHGRANAAIRMICDTVGPANIGDGVKYRSFHLAVPMPHNYRPLSVFADTSRPLTC